MPEHRPVYITLGECPVCRMIEKRLWAMSNSDAMMCVKCFEAHYKVTPRARTADDVSEADTEYKRRKGDT